MNEWEMMVDAYERGVDLDEAGREALLAALGETHAHVAEEVRGLWREAAAEDGTDFDRLREVSKSLLARFGHNRAPERVGPYHVTGTLSEGFNSTVYLAEQRAPICRTVAVKLLHRPLSDAAQQYRFNAEQQALALLVHPHVATVFDSGLTPDGCPFFAMEYLDGAPITEWCDTHELDIPRRLALFMGVCEGVAYAHSKGVVHRDLKPDNILVVERGGRAVAKIIDFGVAKFKTDDVPAPRATRVGMVIGTPAYMSPEQASGRLDVVDTRTDVYALGVILHELLTGVIPLGNQLEAAGSLRAVCRLIETFEAKRPSAVDPGDRAAEICRVRHVPHPAALARILREDLDWIVLAALAREPNERYQAVQQMHEDLHRYLEGLPVSAGRPGTGYMLRKLLRRKRHLVRTAVFVGVTFLAGFAGTVWGWVRTNQALADSRQHLAQRDAVRRFTRGIFARVSPYGLGPEVTGRELLDASAVELRDGYRDNPSLEAATRVELGMAYKGLGLYAKAFEQYEAAQTLMRRTLGADHPDTLTCLNALGVVTASLGRYEEAEGYLRRAVAAWVDVAEPGAPGRLAANGSLAGVFKERGRAADAEALYAAVLRDAAQEPKATGEALREWVALVGGIRNNYGLLLMDQDRPEAKAVFAENLSRCLAVLGERDPLTQTTRHNLARLLERTDPVAALVQFEAIYDVRRELLGADHPETLRTLSSMAVLAGRSGDLARALTLLGPFRERLRAERVPPVVLELTHNLGHFLNEAGRLEEAHSVLTQTVTRRAALLGPTHPDTLYSLATLVENLIAAEHFEAATTEATDLIARAREVWAPERPEFLLLRGIAAYAAWRNGDAAAEAVLRGCRDQLAARMHPDEETLARLLREGTDQVLERPDRTREHQTGDAKP